jgi:hypothetical protein
VSATCWRSNDHAAEYATPDGIAYCKRHQPDGPGPDPAHPGMCRGCGKLRRSTWPVPSAPPDAMGHPVRLCAAHLLMLIRAEPWDDDRFR